MTKQEMILKALNTNVNLSDEEYKKEMEKADNQTAINGATKLAPRSEATRHRRMHMNYMGTTINILLNMMVSLEELAKQNEQVLAEQKALTDYLARAMGIEVERDVEPEEKKQEE